MTGRRLGRTHIRPTATGVWTFSGSGVCLGLAALTGDAWLQLAGLVGLGLLVTAFALTPRYRSSLRFCHRMSPRSVVGGRCEHSLHLHNNSRRPTPPLWITTVGALPGDVQVQVPRVMPGATGRASVWSVPDRRGQHAGALVKVTGQDPCGLFSGAWTLRGPSRTLVHPAPVPVTLPGPSAGPGGARGLLSSDDAEQFELQDWRPGEQRVRINARASARRQRLVVTHREGQARRSVLLVVAVPPTAADTETVVSVSAAAAVAAVRAGLEVYLLAVQSPVPVPVRTTSAALDWFAALSADRPLVPGDVEQVSVALRRCAGVSECWLANSQDVPEEWAALLEARLRDRDRAVSRLVIPAHRRERRLDRRSGVS